MGMSSLVDQHSCKSRTATIRLWPNKFQMARLGKGIKVTLRDFERIRLSMMKETTARIFLKKMDGDTSGIYYTIGLDVWGSQNRLRIDWGTRQNNNSLGSCVGSQTIGLWPG